MTYISIYFAGVLSFLSPCILPLIPVYFSILQGTGKLFHKALMFCFGFCVIFALMGGGVGAIAPFIKTNKETVNLIAGIILLLIGLKFLNVIQIAFLDKGVSINSQKFKTRFELLNAFILGAIFVVIWSPCIGAAFGGILTYVSATGTGVIDGAVKLFVYGVGISTPLILCVFFYQRLVKFYKNSTYFFDMVKKLLGFILIIFALTLFNKVLLVSKHVQNNMSVSDRIMVPEKLPVFISFMSPDCEDCQTMKPIIEKLDAACGGKIVDFRTVNLADSQYEYLAYQQGIFGTPTYILLDESGKEKQRLFGILSLKDLNNDLKTLTGKDCTNKN